jgi:hypothetical protein
MSAQPNQPLIPGGIHPDLWALLSSAQQELFTDGTFPSEDFAANTKITKTYDITKLILSGGYPVGLTAAGKLVWDAIEDDDHGEIGIEAFTNTRNKDSKGKSTLTDVVKYLNGVLADIENTIGSISLNGKHK